jgi:hypothetical protein
VTGRVALSLLVLALGAALAVLAVGAVRSVRSELVLGEAWHAAERSDWPRVLELTQPMLSQSDAGRRAAELHCYALLATGGRDRCGEVLDAVLTAGEGYLPEPMLVRLAVVERQRAGHLDEALALAREATAAHPDDPALLGLELAAHAAVEHEDRVLELFERRLAAAEGPALGLRIALAARYRQRAEWEQALRALGDEVPAAQDERLGPWFEARIAALASLGRLDELQAGFASWRDRGGDAALLEARYALALSLAQLADPEASWVELLERALARGDALADERLRRQLHERVIAHHLAAEDDASALRAFERAQSEGIELFGITREQIERGAALRHVGGDPSAVPEGTLAFALPQGFGGGTLHVSDNAASEPDGDYSVVEVAGGETVELVRRPAPWPERWVLRDREGRVRASGSVWPRPAARSRVAVALRSPANPPAAVATARRAADGRARVFALVLDCADWRLVQYLRARGELPVLEDLFRRGHRAVLLSDPPLTAAAMESLVWPGRGRVTSVAGVVHQLGVELSGLASIGDNPFGFLAPLLPEAESLFARVGAGPQVAANMLFAHGGVAAGRHAEMVGPRGQRRRVQTARARRPLRPDERRRFEGIDEDPQAAGHVEGIAAQLDAALELANAGEVDLLALRLESLDILTHALFSPLASTRQDDGRSNLLAAYRYIDARIGELDARLDGDDVLVVMSDHGIRSAMEHESDALFVAVGGNVPVGRAAGRPDLRGVGRTLAAFVGVAAPWPATGVAAWLEGEERHAGAH